MLPSEVVAQLRVTGRKWLGELPLALKARDPREPGALAKEQAENRFYRMMRAYFRQQKAAVRAAIPLKADALGDELWKAQATIGQGHFGPFLARIARLGVELATNDVSFELDWSRSDERAQQWAMEYAGVLVKDINQVTRRALGNAVADYLALPGYTLQDLMDALPYGDARAHRIAVTEVTRAAAAGTHLAARQIAEEAPGVRLVRQWFTNNDDRVCDICGPLDGQTVEIDRNFPGGIEMPPAHIGCRCWTSTTTVRV